MFIPAYIYLQSYRQDHLSKYWEVKVLDEKLADFDIGAMLNTIDANVNHISGYMVDWNCEPFLMGDIKIRGTTGITTTSIKYDRFESVHSTESEMVSFSKVKDSSSIISVPIRISILGDSTYMLEIRDNTGKDANIDSFRIKVSTIPFGPKCLIL
jgi:hypothetical protein